MVTSPLKRMLRGAYLSLEHYQLFRYLDEQSFRFNQRKGTDSTRFESVTKQTVGKRLTYSALTGKAQDAREKPF